MTEKNTIKGKIRGWDGHFHPYETTGTIINRLTNNRVIVLEKNVEV